MIKKNLQKVLLTGTIIALSLPVMASDTVDTVAIMTTGMNSAKTDILGMVGVALPIGIGLVATFAGIRKGIDFFKTLTTKA